MVIDKICIEMAISNRPEFKELSNMTDIEIDDEQFRIRKNYAN